MRSGGDSACMAKNTPEAADRNHQKSQRNTSVSADVTTGTPRRSLQETPSLS